MQVQVEIAVQSCLVGGKAMYHRRRQSITEVAQDAHQRVAGVALMQEDGITQLHGQLKLLFKSLDLLWAGRKIAVEVQSAFTDGANAVGRSQQAQVSCLGGIPVTGFVGVNAGSAEQPERVRSEERRVGKECRCRV